MKFTTKQTLLLPALLLATSVLAQEAGKVTDAADIAINNARIILRNRSGSALHEAYTNEKGEFSFFKLPRGEYFVSAEVEGMTQIGGEQKITISNGVIPQPIRIKMQVAAIKNSIVVSATRTEASLTEIPANVFVVLTNELASAQRISVLDALRASPGVTVLQTARRGGVTSLFVRGGESDYTKVFIDGIPVNDAGGAFDLSDLTTDNAERIELVRGPNSALYGSDAMSGILHLVTRRGTTPIPEFEFLAEGGSFALNRQAARVAGANSSFDYSLSFSHLRTNGRDRNDDYQNRVASANFGYRFNERANLRMGFRSENSGLGVPGATARYFPDPDERARRRRIATSLRLTDQTTRNWHQTLSIVYAENNQLSLDPAAQDLTKPNTPPDTNFAFNDFVSFFNNHQKRRGIRYQSDLLLPHNNLLSAGVEYEKESAVFDSGFAGTNRVTPDRINLGFFLQNQFFYASRFVLTAGLRVENNRADLPANFANVLQSIGSAPFSGTIGFGTQVAPKLATLLVIHRGNDNVGATKLRASYGEGIKAATLVEAFSPNPFFLGNPGLKPERARSFDVGIEQLFLRNRIRVEATFFTNQFREQIAYVADPGTFGGPIKTPQGVQTSFINNDRARAQGLELTIALRPKQRISISGHYTYTDSQLIAAADVIDFITLKLVTNPEVGSPLIRRPRHSGAFNVAWIGERFDLTLESFLIGRRRDIDPVTFSRLAYNDGYARFDLAGSYRISPRIMAFGRIENLFDKDYQEVLGYPAYRLTFAAGLRLRIGRGK